MTANVCMFTRDSTAGAALGVAEMGIGLEEFADRYEAPTCKQKARELSYRILDQIESDCQSGREDYKIIETTLFMMRETSQQVWQCIDDEIKTKDTFDKALDVAKRKLEEARLNFSAISTGHSLQNRMTKE